MLSLFIGTQWLDKVPQGTKVSKRRSLNSNLAMFLVSMPQSFLKCGEIPWGNGGAEKVGPSERYQIKIS